MKRLLIKLGFHGKAHDKARIQRELRGYAKDTMVEYMFWQGAHGAELNRWRMK